METKQHILTTNRMFYIILLLIVTVSFALRAYGAYTMDVYEKKSDGATYYHMAKSLIEYKELRGLDDRISHQYPPMYPLYLAIFMYLFGINTYVAQTANLVMCALMLAGVYLCSRDLLSSREKALLITAYVSMDWMLIWSAWHNYAESMVLLTFTLTIWAIYKSIDNQKYILLAGLFAGIGYLTKSSMGFFFIVAGLCGFAWRFYFMRWKLFKNIYYMAAVLIFGCFVGTWAVRNLYHFWDGSLAGLLIQWQTSEYIAEATVVAIHEPGRFLLGLILKSFFFAFIYGYMAAPYIKPLSMNLTYLKDEKTSALWLGVGTVGLISLFMVDILWVYEETNPFWIDNYRYTVVSLTTLLWLVFRKTEIKPLWSTPKADMNKANMSKEMFILTYRNILFGIAYYTIGGIVLFLLLGSSLGMSGSIRHRDILLFGLFIINSGIVGLALRKA